MNINESIRDWITSKLSEFPEIASIQLSTGGEESSVTTPFFAIYESSAEPYEQSGVSMYGVTVYEINAELHTVAESEEEGATPATTEREWRDAFYNILGDRDAIAWMEGHNGWRVFDIRLAAPTTEPNEGQRLSRIVMTVTACPI